MLLDFCQISVVTVFGPVGEEDMKTAIKVVGSAVREEPHDFALVSLHGGLVSVSKLPVGRIVQLATLKLLLD